MTTLYVILSTCQYLQKSLYEKFTLGFGKIKWEYNSSTNGWDLIGKKPL